MEKGETVELNHVAQAVASQIAPLAIKAGKSVEVLPANDPIPIIGSFELLACAVRNLVEKRRPVYPRRHRGFYRNIETSGTEISDFIDRSLGLGYMIGSLILLTGLFLSLGIWYLREHDLRVYPIVRRDVEVLFWLTVLVSNSLGTAFGDFLTDNLGYLSCRERL